jgi:hypothetical protein
MEQKSLHQSQLDTFLWSQSPLWEQSSGFTLLQEVEKDSIDLKFNLSEF